MAETLGELVPYHDLHIYEADDKQRELVPVFAGGTWAKEVLESRIDYGRGDHRAGRSSIAARCSSTQRTSTRASPSFPARPPTRRR